MRSVVLSGLLLWGVTSGIAFAQTSDRSTQQVGSGSANTNQPSTPSARNLPVLPSLDTMFPALDAGQMSRAERARKLERKERLGKDSRRLLELTVQFRADVANGDLSMLDEERRLDEIGKLARSVRDRMRE